MIEIVKTLSPKPKMSDKIDVASEIFDNAIAAIELGIEDYKLSRSDSRRLQSSVRNICAGILLLFKCKLADLSKNDDESLLKQKVIPVIQNENIKWVGIGKKTVDVQQIKDRFNSLNIPVEWKLLDDLQDYRNNIEHYFDKQNNPANVVRGYIASSFIVVKNFMEKILKLDPQVYFSVQTWRVFLEEKSIHDSELKEKLKEFQNLKWFSKEIEQLFVDFRCSSCDSDIIKIDCEEAVLCDATNVSFVCRNCGQQWTYQELVIEIADVLSTQSAMEFRDGRQEMIGYCPACGEETYWAEGEICLLCGEKGPFICSFCSDEVPISELPSYAENGMCAGCSHIMEKCDDDD